MDSSEGAETPQTRVHVCGFNDEVKQPVFTLKRDILNTVEVHNKGNIKRETKMTDEELKALRETYAMQNAAHIADKEKITIERDAAIADAKKKCDVNKQLIKDNEDKDATIAEYEDIERKGYVKFFGDKNIKDPSEEKIMTMDVDELKLKKKWVETLLSEINDEKIIEGGIPKPGFGKRKNINDKRKITASSVAKDKKKEEEAEK